MALGLESIPMRTPFTQGHIQTTRPLLLGQDRFITKKQACKVHPEKVIKSGPTFLGPHGLGEQEIQSSLTPKELC